MILKTFIILGVNKFLLGIIYILIFIYEIKNLKCPELFFIFIIGKSEIT